MTKKQVEVGGYEEMTRIIFRVARGPRRAKFKFKMSINMSAQMKKARKKTRAPLFCSNFACSRTADRSTRTHFANRKK